MTFKELLKRCSATAYQEDSTNAGHKTISEMAIQFLDKKLARGSRILDVGIGNGFALAELKRLGHDPVGISVSIAEVDAAVRSGFSAYQCDMHDISVEKLGYFDGVFARHVLEHSPCPLLVLHQLRDVLKPKGFLYLETPAHDTFCRHEKNPNHFSVLPFMGWAKLVNDAGFTPLEGAIIPLATPVGTDAYFSIYAQKA